MLYEYTCPNCGWKGDRLCRIADRDKQRCEERVPRHMAHWWTVIDEEDAMGLSLLERPLGPDETDGLRRASLRLPCRTPLVREEISSVSCMALNWGAWNGSHGGTGR